MSYRLVQQLQQSCQVLEISRSGYYAARQLIKAACATTVRLRSL
ncbi:MAG: hypothetical protein ACXW01_10905 [Methylobacter sp.]